MCDRAMRLFGFVHGDIGNHRTRMTGIYAIVNVLTGRRYVGRSVDIYARWSQHRSHLNRGIHANTGLMADWLHYGAIHFRFEFLEQVDDHAVCIKREREYLRESIGLYNASSNSGTGPKPGFKMSPESRERIAASKRGKPRSAETKAAMSAGRKGKKYPKHGAALRGRKLPQSTREAMSLAHKARYAEHPRSENTRAKLSAALSGHVKSPEWCAAISAAKIGKPWSAKRRAAFEARYRNAICSDSQSTQG
jgi:group I intron endonuclease